MSIWEQQASKGGEGGTWELAPAGSQPAVLVAIIDLGTHHERFAGQEKAKPSHKAFFVWELTDAPMEALKGVNHCIGQKFTVSLNEKAALTGMLKQWGKILAEGEKFNIKTLLGKACMVTVNHNKSGDGTKTYANYGGLAPVPKMLKDKMPAAKVKPFVWEILTERGAAEDALAKLLAMTWMPKYVYGEKIDDIIRNSDEWQVLKALKALKQPNGNQETARHTTRNASEFDDSDPQQQLAETMSGTADDEIPF